MSVQEFPETTRIIDENRLLATLRPSGLPLLQPHLKEIVLKQGTLLQEQEDRVERAYFPLSGMISLLAVMGDGQAIETATVGREGTVGAMSGLGPWHAASRAVVTAPGTAFVIAASRLQDAVKQSEHLRNVILHYKETLLAQVQQTAGCNALHDAKERLDRWLLQTRDRVNSDRMPLTQELIRYHRGYVEIINRNGLEQAACECYGIIRQRTDQALPQAVYRQPSFAATTPTLSPDDR